MDKLAYVLVEDRGLIENAIRAFFMYVSRFAYRFFSGAIDLMYDLGRFDFGLDDYIENINQKVFGLLIIFMIFKLTISFLNYLIDPESIKDNKKGGSGILKRVVISVVLLTLINPIFSVLKDLERSIFDDDIINSVLLYSNDENVVKVGNYNLVGVQMSPYCPPNKKVYTVTTGDRIALLLFRPFLQPSDKEGIEDNTSDAWDAVFDSSNTTYYESRYCGWDISQMKEVIIDPNDYKSNSSLIKAQIPGPNSAEGFLIRRIINLSADEAHDKGKSGASGNGVGTAGVYFYDFNYFFALIAAIIGLLVVISFCFDVVIRSLTLILLQMIAPIPIIAYASPGSKSSEMLGIWLKKIGSTWVSLFIRIASLSLGITFIDRASTIIGGSNFTNGSLMLQLFIIFGTLMFAKKLPSLIEELIPGLKLGGGFKLNPLKRMREDALGGKEIFAGSAALGAYGLSAATNFGQRSLETFRNVRNADGMANRLRAAVGGTLRTAGSTVAGGTRAGVNAFNRTRKDGHLLSGMWNGHQTAMYSKLLREENRRKGATAGGAIRADLHRWTGTLTEGQREQILAEQQDQLINQHEDVLRERKEVVRQRKDALAINQRQLAEDKRDLSNKKRQLAQRKHDELEPYEMFSNYAVGIKNRIDTLVDNDSSVKQLNRELEIATAAGDADAVRNIKNILDQTKDGLKAQFFNSDSTIMHYRTQLELLQDKHVKLKGYNFTKTDANGETVFDASVMNKIDGQKAIIADGFKNDESAFTLREREFEARQTSIDRAQAQIDEYQRVNIDEYQRVNIDEFKNSQEYKNAHQKDSPAKTDNATQFNNKVQEPGHMFSQGQPPQATFTQQSFFGGMGGQPGGPGTPPPPPPGGGPRNS